MSYIIKYRLLYLNVHTMYFYISLRYLPSRRPFQILAGFCWPFCCLWWRKRSLEQVRITALRHVRITDSVAAGSAPRPSKPCRVLKASGEGWKRWHALAATSRRMKQHSCLNSKWHAPLLHKSGRQVFSLYPRFRRCRPSWASVEPCQDRCPGRCGSHMKPTQYSMRHRLPTIWGFPQRGYPKVDCLYGKIPLKLMIWGYPH